jgi:adenylate kinase
VRVYIGGVSGVGKSCIGRRLASLLQVPHITGSSVIMQEFGAKDHLELAGLDLSGQGERIRSAFVRTYQTTPSLVADGHYRLDPEEIPFFEAFFLLSALPERLIALRQGDQGRVRACTSQDIQREIQEVEARAATLESSSNVAVHRVLNEGTEIQMAEALFLRIQEIRSCSPSSL